MSEINTRKKIPQYSTTFISSLLLSFSISLARISSLICIMHVYSLPLCSLPIAGSPPDLPAHHQLGQHFCRGPQPAIGNGAELIVANGCLGGGVLQQPHFTLQHTPLLRNSITDIRKGCALISWKYFRWFSVTNRWLFIKPSITCL